MFTCNQDKVQSLFSTCPTLETLKTVQGLFEPRVVKGDGELKTICRFQLSHTMKTLEFSLISLHGIFHFCRRSPRLVRLCPLVGTETLLASENTLDSGQMWGPGRRKASLHPSAQNASPPPAKRKDSEVASQFLRCGF